MVNDLALTIRCQRLNPSGAILSSTLASLYNFKPNAISASNTEEDIVDEESENFDLQATVRLRQTETFKSISSLNWQPQIANLGEVAGVDTDNNGDIWVFHR